MRATIYNDDCFNVFESINDASVDLIITDPPYILSALSHGALHGKIGTWADMMNSAFGYASWYRHIKRILRPSGSFWTFCNWRSFPVVIKALYENRMAAASVVVWNKMLPGTANKSRLRPYYELIVLFSMPEFEIKNRATGNIWEFRWQGHHRKTGHPAEKPVDLIKKIIFTCSISSGVVFDPFMGSGTTGVAAAECGLDFIGIESDTHWFYVAEERIKNTGNAEIIKRP